uniref:Uncharacterized protein n=1 Tax=Glossina palpalis gambiensis TaxID=67801 RepID=A0A1B0BMP1_9MUSC
MLEQKRGVVLMAASTQSISWDFICAMLPSSRALGLEPYPLQNKRKGLCFATTCQEILKPKIKKKNYSFPITHKIFILWLYPV